MYNMRPEPQVLLPNRRNYSKRDWYIIKFCTSHTGSDQMALYFTTANSLGVWLSLCSMLALKYCDSAPLGRVITSLHTLVGTVSFVLLLPLSVQSVIHGHYHHHLDTQQRKFSDFIPSQITQNLRGKMFSRIVRIQAIFMLIKIYH